MKLIIKNHSNGGTHTFQGDESTIKNQVLKVYPWTEHVIHGPMNWLVDELNHHWATHAFLDVLEDPEPKDKPSHVYKDTVYPHLGNNLAFEAFAKEFANKGIHLAAQLGDLGDLNPQQIKFVKDALFSPKTPKGFRAKSEVYRAEFENKQSALEFAHALQSKISSLASQLNGRLINVNIGIGFTPNQAIGLMVHGLNHCLECLPPENWVQDRPDRPLGFPKSP